MWQVLAVRAALEALRRLEEKEGLDPRGRAGARWLGWVGKAWRGKERYGAREQRDAAADARRD
jgi:hypothetical protein